MGTLLQYFKFLLRIMKGGLGFIVSLPGLMTIAIVVAAAVIVSISSSVYDSGSIVYQILIRGKDAVDSFMAFMSNSEYFPYLRIFYDLFALDVFFQCFTSFVTLVGGLLVVTAVEGVFMGVVVISNFLTWKVLAKTVKQLTAGKLDVS